MCHEPMASQSVLAQSVLQLLETQDNVDLDFILPDDSGSGQAQILKAHRVILAARCHWFHRALLSDMREAIDRYVLLKKLLVVDFFHQFRQKLLFGHPCLVIISSKRALAVVPESILGVALASIHFVL